MSRCPFPCFALLALGVLAPAGAVFAAPPPVANAPYLPGFDAAVRAHPAPPPPTPAPAAPAQAPAGDVGSPEGTLAAGLGLDSSASDYMAAAAQAVAQQQGDVALKLLGRAETRLISRSVPLYQTHNPSEDPAVRQIEQARAAVRASDFATAAAVIARATPLVTQEENAPPPNPPVGLPTAPPPG